MKVIVNYKIKTKVLTAIFFSLLIQNSITGTVYAKTVSQKNIVVMNDDYFTPSTITITAGQGVTWVNKGERNHTVNSADGYFDSGTVPPGSSYSYTFTKPGTYKYSCIKHTLFFMGMKGKVIVQ